MKHIAIVIFHDQKNIILQERGVHAKMGEKYGFWGGGIEKKETPQQAIRRELIEELNYSPKTLEFWTDYSFTVTQPGPHHGLDITLHIFLSPITEELLSSKIEEGSGFVTLSIQEALTHPDLDWVEREVVGKLNSFLWQIYPCP